VHGVRDLYAAWMSWVCQFGEVEEREIDFAKCCVSVESKNHP